MPVTLKELSECGSQTQYKGTEQRHVAQELYNLTEASSILVANNYTLGKGGQNLGLIIRYGL